ncbi:MAG: peptidoglycan DD-metalloendopeptidase family protein [Xanthomonadales bacterium]|nr:peptidoglycan DD-metalloendopeptidase family protein [Xanthomonadales bacterium]
MMPWLTRQRLAVFAVTLIAVGIALEGIDPGTEAASQEAGQAAKLTAREIVPLDLPMRAESSVEKAIPPADSPEAPAYTAGDWISVEVRPGQTFGAILTEQGFSPSVVNTIVDLDDNTRKLKRIRPGDVFRFRKDETGEFVQMRHAFGETHNLIVSNEDGHFRAELQQREITTEVKEAEGVISSSLYVAAKAAGLSDPMVMELANIFGWDIDFILDIREGDRFFVVYEKIYREGEFLRDGRILAASFVNQGQRYQAIRYESEQDVGYFAPDGRPMRKEFLRAPLNFSYISSGFNPARMHPVLKRIRPHRGIDYYAPRGTPVYASGAGTVIRSAYSNANGHHVFIKHANGIETRYLHFTNRAVQQGQKVQQGQTIGYVGSTGLATGPHLHYEFLVDGVHRNPRTVALGKVDPLEGEVLTAFRKHAAPMLTRLSRLESASFYASAP